MNKAYLGIDLGTSSVKAVLMYSDKTTQKAKRNYSEISPSGWFSALCDALGDLDLKDVCAVGLSSQVGTYIIDEKEVLSWNDGIGKEETEIIKKKYPESFFISEISMPHPDIISYPIPRLMYIKEKYGDNRRVMQPKDFICKMLTGVLVTDKYSWRGLANIKTGEYSSFFLKELGNPILPEIKRHNQIAGYITKEASLKTGLSENIPVYTGLNDFFAGIYGMGVKKPGEVFDITGTSEHLGIICDALKPGTKMVSGPFIENFVHYGVTASSGVSLDFAISEFGLSDIELTEDFIKSSPLFLPYLNGERAPIFDAFSSGVFFGMDKNTKKKHLAYSVLEGVAMSIYHIYENLDAGNIKSMTISGGASVDKVLNTIKATLFNVPVITLKEKDVSAMGALLCCMEDCKDFIPEKDGEFLPIPGIRDILIKRFSIYKNLYIKLKDEFKNFKEVQL